MAPSIDKLLERLSSLEEAVRQTKEQVAAADARAARAEARAARLESSNGHTVAAVKNDAISRRSLLTKAAAVGAAGVAGALLLNRPKDVFASFTWTGGATNNADLPTYVLANAGFAGPAMLTLDGNVASNPAVHTDGLRAQATGNFSGVAAYGGPKGGVSYYGFGGNGTAGTGGNQAGGYLYGSAGTNIPGGFSWAAQIYNNGASDGTAGGFGMYLGAGGNGYGLFTVGGGGTNTTPATNGGVGMWCYSGPGNTAAHILGDPFGANPAVPSHGVHGTGNGLGVGGYFSGGRAQVQIIPNGGVGAPTTGQHFAGDLYMDAHEVIWVCTAAGVPGTFAPLQPGGINKALFTAVSAQQYTFVGSDGATWVDIDATNLILTITPAYNCQAVFTASADLWTGTVGYNQDIGVSISGGAYPTTAGQPEGWKESSGAASFSPNAAHLDVVAPLAQGTAYTIKLVWKANKPAAGKLIAAGAGPIGGKFSPTRLLAWLVPTNPGGTIPRTPEVPFTRQLELPQRPPAVDAYGRSH